MHENGTPRTHLQHHLQEQKGGGQKKQDRQWIDWASIWEPQIDVRWKERHREIGTKCIYSFI